MKHWTNKNKYKNSNNNIYKETTVNTETNRAAAHTFVMQHNNNRS